MAKPGTYKLLAYYSLISLIAMIATAILLSFLFHRIEMHYMLYLGEKQNIALSRAFSNALWPSVNGLLRQSSELLKEDLENHPLTSHINQLLTRFTSDLEIVNIEIYNREGVTVFSTQTNQIGQDQSHTPGFLASQENRIVSEMVHRVGLPSMDGTIEDRDLITSYTPLRQEEKFLGAFRLDYNITPLLSHLTKTQNELILQVIGVFLFLYWMLFFVVRRGSLIIKEQHNKLTQYLLEISQNEENLKARVEERTETLRITNDILKAEIAERQQAEGELRKLSQAVEQSPASVVITNLKAQVEYVNPKFCQVTGYSEEEILGKNPGILKSGKNPPDAYKHMWEVISSGEQWRGEFHNRRKDGSLFWELASISPIRNQYGKVTHYVAVKEDITELKATLESLQHSETRLRTIMDNVTEAIFSVTKEGIIKSANPGAGRIFGFKPETMIGSNCSLLVPTTHKEVHDTYIKNFLQQNSECDGFFQRESLAQRQDGSLFPMELTVNTVQTGGKVQFIATIRDISERKKNEEDLAKARQMSYHQEKMASIGTLAAGILHEINNPTSAISGILEAIIDINENSDPEFTGYLTMMQEQIERITGITREVSEFSMPQTDEVQLLDINNLIEKCSNLMRFDQRMRNIHLRLKLDRGLPAIDGSSAQLSQVIINFLLNAADALENQTSTTPEVVISTQLDHNQVKISVADNGSGMDEKTKTQVFDAFFTTKAVGKGTGLGLSLCYSILSKHKGHIEVHSTLKKGSTFCIFLPLP